MRLLLQMEKTGSSSQPNMSSTEYDVSRHHFWLQAKSCSGDSLRVHARLPEKRTTRLLEQPRQRLEN
jgi:hypothetical protein